jgi:hypothetical protein
LNTTAGFAARRLQRAKQLFSNWIYPGKWRRQFLFNAQRSVLEPHKRELVADVTAALVRARHGQPFSRVAEPLVADGARALRNEGFVQLGSLLSAERCDEIVRWVKGKPVCSLDHPHLGRFQPEDAPEECHVVQYPQEVILECPYLLELANDPRILALAEKFLGAKPTISNLSFWWSLSGRSKPKAAQLFHRDVDDIKFCKLFVYLTDVDLKTGPHVFVRNSPPVDLCMGLGRYSDAEVKAAFGDDAITYFCGPRGAAFLVNTFGVHKGLLPREGNRLLFQVQYSLLPIFLYDYYPARRPAEGFSHDRYVNRLYIQPEAR